jgi:hypothetical protein
MIERIRRSGAKAGLRGASVAPGSPERWAVFGPPQLLQGEDAAAYAQLLARVCAAVKPVDMIDEMFIVDVVSGMGGLTVAPLEIWFASRAQVSCAGKLLECTPRLPCERTCRNSSGHSSETTSG